MQHLTINAGIELYLNLESKGGVKCRGVSRQKKKLAASKHQQTKFMALET